jgi:simple sugar transport system permease protein
MRHDMVLALARPEFRAMKLPVPRAAMTALASLAIFAVLLLIAGKDPLRAYHDTLIYVFGNTYGFSELLVRMTPVLLTAVAVALVSSTSVAKVNFTWAAGWRPPGHSASPAGRHGFCCR